MIDYINDFYKYKAKYNKIYYDENVLSNYNEIIFITNFNDIKKNIFN